MRAWVEDWNFKEYDPDWINDRLKGIDYKKTQWDKIKYEHYKVLEDKYWKQDQIVTTLTGNFEKGLPNEVLRNSSK